MKIRLTTGYIITALILMLGIIPVRAQQPSAWARLDSTNIMIGEQLRMEIGVTIKPGTVVVWPPIGDTLTHSVEVIKMSGIDTLKQDGIEKLIQQLTLTSFDSGMVIIPAQEFTIYQDSDSLSTVIRTNQLIVQVSVPVVDTSLAIKPIAGPVKEPYTFQEILPWGLGGLAVLSLIILLIWYIRKRKGKTSLFTDKARPLLPAHVVAITKLEELRLAKVWQSGKIKEYHSMLTDIIREYLDNRYHFDAPEMTSDEIMEHLKGLTINDEVIRKVNGVFFLSDMVKFAKAQPTALENDLSLSHCVDFVNETAEETGMEETNTNGEIQERS